MNLQDVFETQSPEFTTIEAGINLLICIIATRINSAFIMLSTVMVYPFLTIQGSLEMLVLTFLVLSISVPLEMEKKNTGLTPMSIGDLERYL